MQISTFLEGDKALKWADDKLPFKQNNLVKEHPWSRVYELNSGSTTTYLKLVPENRRHTLQVSTAIASHFDHKVPQVIAVDENLGLQLEKHHGGIELTSESSINQKRNLLTTYARIQTEASKARSILETIPLIDIDQLTDDFIDFFKTENPDKNLQNGKINAGAFLKQEDSKEYYDVLSVRKHLLKDFLKHAPLLPSTLNHCDLQTKSAAERNDGSVVIFDWDNALIGPAGLSLPKFFGNAFNIYRYLWGLLDDDTKISLQPDIELMEVYVNELAGSDYADRQTLVKSIPASACAGAMRAVLDNAKLPALDSSDRSNAYEEITTRLDDILNICDSLSCSNRDDAMHLAQDYIDRGILFRAILIYKQYAKIHSNDLEVQSKLAAALKEKGRWEEAIVCYKSVIKQNPADTSSLNNYGLTLLKLGQPENAIGQFEIALSILPDFRDAKTNLEAAEQLLSMKDQAQRPNKLPTISVSDGKEKTSVASQEKIELAYSLFKKYGALQLENIFDTELINDVKSYVFEKYESYLLPREYDNCLSLGKYRHMVTLDIDGPINSPTLYDNPTMTAVAKKILGDDFILGSINIAVALPGAPHQSIHREHPPLFQESDRFRDDMPCYAVAILVPLIQPSPIVGTTLVVKGSQNMSFEETETSGLPSQAYSLDLGSCIMVDYKVWHQGLANNSKDTIRPLLTIVFQRSWFRDGVNYTKQAPIKISEKIYNEAPDRLRELLSWIKPNTAISS